MCPASRRFRHDLRGGLHRLARVASLACVLAGGGAIRGDATGLVSAPLSPRSGPPAATLFSELPAAVSGIVAANAYADPRMWADRFHEHGVGAIGTGVSVGDYDNDGLPDVLVVSKVETCRLFHNLGGWKFEDVTERANIADFSGEWKQGASFADVDNDGWLDLYVCRFGVANQLFINQRDGTFREEAQARGLAVVDASGMAAFADYDRDGWLDVYVQTNLLNASARPNGQPDFLFRNNGDGTFTNVTARAGIAGESQGHSATWWDYDEDGWPDIYVANDFAIPDFLYRNNRDGTFTKVTGHVLPHTAGTAMGADLGDVNNDGRMDFLVADMATTTHEKDQRGMADTRGQARDFQADDPAVAPQLPRNALYLNTGVGRMQEAAILAGLAATDWTWSVRFEDLDNDGRLDLHVTNGMNREQTNLDLLLAMMKAESAQERVRLMKASPVLAEANLAYRNVADLQFEEVGAAWGLNQHGVSFGAAFGDFDGDGDLDLIQTNFQRDPTLLRNEGVSGHRIVVALRGTASNRFGVGATVRIVSAQGEQVRVLTLARGYLSTSEPIVHFGLGSDERVQHLSVMWPSGRIQTFADLPVDARYTITEPDQPAAASGKKDSGPGIFTEASAALGLSHASREEKLEGTVPQAGLPLRFNRRGPGVAVADLDGDGTDEIVIGATTQDAVRVLRRKGGSYEVVAVPALGRAPAVNGGPPLVLDVQGLGRADLLLTGGGAAFPAEEPEYEPTLYLNDGRGGLRAAPAGSLPSLPASIGAVATADFDRDGRLDVFLGARVAPGYFPEIPTSALWANREGRLVDVTEQVAPGLRAVGLVTSAVWSDVDGDGWIDLLVALEWGTVRFFKNQQGRTFEDHSESAGFARAGPGLWSSLASADFNSDGRPDYFAGNVGLNTPLQAAPGRPEVLLAADFNGSGVPQVVSAHHEGARLLPRQSRRELGVIFPDILKRFPRNDPFARATIDEIVGKERLARATRLVATELRSGVFLSQSDGAYRFVALPRIAQIAPVQGAVAADFDGDGKADLCLAHNSFAPIAAWGRFDGGLGQFLRGDGAGNFLAVSPAESQFVTPGDAKALTVVDVDADGWPDLFASRNNATALVFRNNGHPGRRMLGVNLAGLPGNPHGVGARVEVEFTDGSRQVAEIHAGGGFASQSTGTIFAGYRSDNPPLKVRVRWPTGKSSETGVAPDDRVVKISQPLK